MSRLVPGDFALGADHVFTTLFMWLNNPNLSETTNNSKRHSTPQWQLTLECPETYHYQGTIKEKLHHKHSNLIERA